MGLTEEISTLATIYTPSLTLVLSLWALVLSLLTLVLWAPILSLATLSRTRRVLRTSRTGRRRRRAAGLGYRMEDGSTDHGCRGAHEKIYSVRLEVRTFRFGWLLDWVRRMIFWLRRISCQQRLGFLRSVPRRGWPRRVVPRRRCLRRAIPRRGCPRRGRSRRGRSRRGRVTATQTQILSFPRITEYGQQGAGSYSDMKVALLNWRGQGSGHIRCSKGKDNDSHIRGHC